MPLTVLSDDQVKVILESLSPEELDDFRTILSSALHDFSTNADSGGSYTQPNRISTFNQTSQATSLYMPSSGPEGMSCKIVSLTNSDTTQDSATASIPPTGVLNLFHPNGQPLGLLQASTLTAFRTALASACLLSRRARARTLLVFGAGSQAYWHVRLALKMRGPSIRRVHVVNHRFSDSATSLLRRFSLIPASVKEAEGWADAEFSVLTPAFHDYERLLREHLLESDVVYCCTPSKGDLFPGDALTTHEGRKKGRLVVAVGSFTPEMRELPEELLRLVTKQRGHHEKPHRHFHKHADEGGVVVVDTLEGALKEAGEIVAAKIEPTQLVELGELVMLHRLKVEESESDTLSSQTTNTTSDSDRLTDHNGSTSSPSMSSVFASSNNKGHSSPRSQSPTSPRSSFHLPFRKSSGSSGDLEKKKKEHEDGLCRWLRDGTVVYKSVGLGLMDLVVGQHLVKVSQEKGVGTQIPDF